MKNPEQGKILQYNGEYMKNPEQGDILQCNYDSMAINYIVDIQNKYEKQKQKIKIIMEQKKLILYYLLQNHNINIPGVPRTETTNARTKLDDTGQPDQKRMKT